MKFLVFDDLGLLQRRLVAANGEVEVFGPHSSQSIDQYFADYCAQKLRGWKADRHGLILLHAHAKFSDAARRQDLQGVELLKHIRLSPWLEHLSSWHAIVYSFESLEQILYRHPSNLVLTSPGVTFLRLPEPRDLREALRDLYRNPDLSLEGLAKVNAPLDRRSFRPYVACDYVPPDSAHETSNLWGLYEMWPTCLAKEFPEVDAPEELPGDVLAFVLSLSGKKARWLEGERSRQTETTSAKTIEALRAACKDKRIVLVDDEGERGWEQFLRLLVIGTGDGGGFQLWTPDPALLVALRETLIARKNPQTVLKTISAQIGQHKPDLVILDLRLAGSEEFATPASKSTGMQLAHILRESDPFLPILLFTASNKAETLLISNSYDIDRYWTKPGLGEHRGPGSSREDIASLAEKIEHLVGPDYVWLQHIARDLSAIETAAANTWWWERTIQWPNPTRTDSRPINGLSDPIKASLILQPARGEVRTAMRELLFPMMEALRIALRLELRDAQEEGLPTPELLRAGIFNQIGKVVELVHGFSDGTIREDFQSAGTVGGRSDAQDNVFVFFRRDWCAFRLFAQRNEWSHVRVIDKNNRFAVLVNKTVTGPSKEDTVTAVSELMAWLTVSSVKADPQEIRGKEDQRFRLCPGDRLSAGQRQWARLSSKAAASRDFYECLTRRQEYQPWIAKAEDLKISSRKVTKK